jgi:hypothetical protein
MVAHDPLTPSQQAILQELQHASIEMSIQEQGSTTRGRDLQFLGQAGLVHIEQTYVSMDPAQNRFRYSKRH